MNGFKRRTDKDRAKNFINETLLEGAVEAIIIYKKATEQDLSKRTLGQAKAKLNAKSFKEGKVWYWKLI